MFSSRRAVPKVQADALARGDRGYAVHRQALTEAWAFASATAEVLSPCSPCCCSEKKLEEVRVVGCCCCCEAVGSALLLEGVGEEEDGDEGARRYVSRMAAMFGGVTNCVCVCSMRRSPGDSCPVAAAPPSREVKDAPLPPPPARKRLLAPRWTPGQENGT